MIAGITAKVEARLRLGRDGLGNDGDAWAEPVEVPGVLVSPGQCADLDATRPEGVRVALTLHFPKGFDGGLRGARVTLPAPWGGTWRVVGDPKPYMDANCPGPWHMPVEVEAVDG